MSEYQVLTVLAAFAFFYSVVASRLERTPINGPVVYLFVGLACGTYGLGLVELDVDREMLKRLAEWTLALVLFSDSANANLGTTKGHKGCYIETAHPDDLDHFVVGVEGQLASRFVIKGRLGFQPGSAQKGAHFL